MGSSHCKTKRVQNLRGIVYSGWKAATEVIRRIPSRDETVQPPSSAGWDACGLRARNRHCSTVRRDIPLRTAQATRSQSSEEEYYVTDWVQETTAGIGNRRKTLMRCLFAKQKGQPKPRLEALTHAHLPGGSHHERLLLASTGSSGTEFRFATEAPPNDFDN